MAEKKIKKEHYEVLFEDIKGKFDAIMEGHVVLDHKIDNLKTELIQKIEFNAFMIKTLDEKLDKKVVELKDEIRKVGDKDFGELSRAVEGHEERIGVLERKAA